MQFYLLGALGPLERFKDTGDVADVYVGLF